jgi:hypothetical protein
MICYIVSFEPADATQATRIETRIKELKQYCPVNKYCWAVMSDLKPGELAEHFRPIIGPKDRIFVIRSGTAAAWLNSYGEKWDEWLKKNL